MPHHRKIKACGDFIFMSTLAGALATPVEQEPGPPSDLSQARTWSDRRLLSGNQRRRLVIVLGETAIALRKHSYQAGTREP
jgi:hypothetical protein